MEQCGWRSIAFQRARSINRRRRIVPAARATKLLLELTDPRLGVGTSARLLFPRALRESAS
jgi:hypothetical protein